LALATGKLLTPQMQAQRLQTVEQPGIPPQDGYGLGIFNLGGWIGHNGSLPGYQTVVVYLPQKQTTLVILINADGDYQGGRRQHRAGKRHHQGAGAGPHLYD
jgi:D-alanyl-D-alanine carboxypeptidase